MWRDLAGRLRADKSGLTFELTPEERDIKQAARELDE